jgi:hypothetical protein
MDQSDFDKVISVLRDRGATISTISDYLKGRSLSHSANSWEELISKRLQPAFEEGALTEKDIQALLRDVEDYGRQHVFLYRDSSGDVASLLKATEIANALKAIHWDPSKTKFAIAGIPADVELIDVHYKDGKYLSFKFAERRELEVVEKVELPEGILHRKSLQPVRAIDVVTFLESGLLEFRVAMIKGTKDYAAVVEVLWDKLSSFLPRDQFGEKDLSKLRRKFTIKPTETVRKIVRVRSTTGIHEEGAKFTSNPTGDLMKAEDTVQGMAAFGGKNTARLGHMSVVFLAQKEGQIPQRDLGVIFTDAVNELRIIPRCTQREFEYLRGQFIKYS